MNASTELKKLRAAMRKSNAGRKALPPEEKKKRVATSLARDVVAIIEDQSVKLRKPKAQIIEEAIRNYYKNN